MAYPREDMLELKRQLVHLLNGSLIACAVYFLKPVFGLLILAPLVAALSALHAAPKLKPDLKIANHLMYHFERKKDIESFPFKGAIFYGLGIVFPITLLEAPEAAAVILVLSVGDSFSNLVGRRYGKTKIMDKSLEGSAAFFGFSYVGAALLVEPVLAASMAFVGALIELFSFADDNLTIPLGLSLLALVL